MVSWQILCLRCPLLREWTKIRENHAMTVCTAWLNALTRASKTNCTGRHDLSTRVDGLREREDHDVAPGQRRGPGHVPAHLDE